MDDEPFAVHLPEQPFSCPYDEHDFVDVHMAYRGDCDRDGIEYVG